MSVFTSKVHKVYMEKQSELYPSKPAHQFKPLSDTGWACRFSQLKLYVAHLMLLWQHCNMLAMTMILGGLMM